METLTIDLINPKAKKLLKDLMDLKLINIRKSESKTPLSELLEKLRSNSSEEITMEEITAEVEAVRKERYEATKNHS
jgi:uncharacterized protein YaaW (UPF0174 family)